MTLMTVAMLVVGLAILTLGAEFLIRGASRLASVLGVSPLVIGLTIVAYGTSTPELVVSVQSGLKGQDDVAVANVVGSNIFNVLAILGPCALLLPLKVSSQLIRLDVPIMIGSSLLVWLLASDGRIGTVDGLLLTSLIAVYTIWSIVKSRSETKEIQQEYDAEYGPAESGGRSSGAILKDLALIVAGLVFLVLGGQWFVDGSIQLARFLGISEVIIGLTIIAIGTSLPELATSLVATIRGERDIAIGNVVGSCIYNLLSILGIASLVTPGGLAVDPPMLHVDIPVMVLVAIVCLPIFLTGMTISRAEGLFFFVGYILYTAYLILDAEGHGNPHPAADVQDKPVALHRLLPEDGSLPYGKIALSTERSLAYSLPNNPS
ncbi:calcium/sodium antiporter [bacterium]|nr:calcium/sodium antiporter [bacterium]